MRSKLGLLIALTALAGCGGHAAISSCSPADYRVSVADQGATGSLVGMAALIARRTSSKCHLHARLSFAVQQQVGGDWKTVRTMVGNPAHARLIGVLKRHAPLGHDWAWWNYCGPQGRFRFLVSAGGENASLPVTPPDCRSGVGGPGGGPGRIRPFPPRGP
jgi:hypothetical protein